MQNETRTEEVRRLRQARGWKLWLVPKSFDLVTTPLCLSMPLLYAYTHIGNGCDCDFFWRVEGEIGALMLALVLIDRLEYWFFGEMTPVRVAVGLLLARALLIEITTLVDNFDLSPMLYLVPPFLGTLYFGRRIGAALAVLVWGIYPIKHYLYNPHWLQYPFELQYFSIYSVGLLFCVAMAWVFTQEKASRKRAEQLLAELEGSHRRLKLYAEQVEELATAKERTRLARDIHDSLGHYLTVINVQLEKALVFRDKKPHDADQAVGNAKALATEALHEVRRSVSVLRSVQESFSSSAAIQALVERIQGHPQIAVEIEGEEAGFTGESLMALYRAAQEGLTNIQKHAGASQARLALRFDEDEATLLLSDDGRGFEPARLETLSPGRIGAYGLQGVRERLELVGGSLLVESVPGAGTRMLARVPNQPIQRRG